jgi:hypothetical protein
VSRGPAPAPAPAPLGVCVWVEMRAAPHGQQGVVYDSASGDEGVQVSPPEKSCGDPRQHLIGCGLCVETSKREIIVVFDPPTFSPNSIYLASLATTSLRTVAQEIHPDDTH